MKKVFAMMLVLSMMLCAVASAEGTLDVIKAKGELVIGTEATYGPYEFLDDNSNPIGCDIWLAQKIADEIGVTLKVTDMNFDGIIPAVQAGSVDLGIAAFTVNAERAKQGLSALTVSTVVQQAAQTRAGELQTSFSHTRPSGASCFTALTEAGVSYARAGENIAYGQSTPEAVVQSWMSSSGHRANILSSSFTTIGIGCTVVNGTAYWAQLFTA